MYPQPCLAKRQLRLFKGLNDKATWHTTPLVDSMPARSYLPPELSGQLQDLVAPTLWDSTATLTLEQLAIACLGAMFLAMLIAVGFRMLLEQPCSSGLG
jgi:hypothetical protein